MEPALTQLLNEIQLGKAQAPDRLFTYLYNELKTIASQQLRGERKVELEATGLVHEAFVRLFGAEPASWENRRHFFGAAARAMRRIVVDVARSRSAQKRGGDRLRVTLNDGALPGVPSKDPSELLDLHEALNALEKEDESLSRLVELRFFAGQTMESIAEILGTSVSSVERKWRLARAFLVMHLAEDGEA